MALMALWVLDVLLFLSWTLHFSIRNANSAATDVDANNGTTFGTTPVDQTTPHTTTPLALDDDDTSPVDSTQPISTHANSTSTKPNVTKSPNVCSPNCAGKGECNTTTKVCKDGCKAGFSGDACTLPKAINNATGNCSTNGTCETCVAGKYGINCSQTCSKNCLGQRICHQDTGKCSEGCIRGFAGLNCSEECSKDCVDGVCDMVTLSCTKGSSAAKEEELKNIQIGIIAVLVMALALGSAVVFMFVRMRARGPPVFDQVNQVDQVDRVQQAET